MMRRFWMGICCVLLLPLSVRALDDTSLEERLKSLEKAQAEIYHSLQEKKAPVKGTEIGDYLKISGLVEIEAGFESLKERAGRTVSASDLSLATAQLGFQASWDEMLAGNLVLLYEEGEDFEVDEATIAVSSGPLRVSAGRQYVPFGVYYSHFITSAALQDLGETREAAVTIGLESGRLAVSVFAFNGDAEKLDRSEDHVNDVGAAIDLAFNEMFSLGGSCLSDLADSDAELLAGDYASRVAGWSGYAVLDLKLFAFSLEALGALEKFAADDLDADGDGVGDQPLAWNFEIAHYPNASLEVAFRVEGSEELAEVPELQCGLNLSYGFHEHATISGEYLYGEFDETFSPGSDVRHLGLLQLALNF